MLCQGHLLVILVFARNGSVQLHTSAIDPVNKAIEFEEKEVLDQDAEEGTASPAEVVDDEGIDGGDLAEVPDAEHQRREHSCEAMNREGIDVHVDRHVDGGVQELRQELSAHEDVDRLGKNYHIEEVD